MERSQALEVPARLRESYFVVSRRCELVDCLQGWMMAVQNADALKLVERHLSTRIVRQSLVALQIIVLASTLLFYCFCVAVRGTIKYGQVGAIGRFEADRGAMLTSTLSYQ